MSTPNNGTSDQGGLPPRRKKRKTGPATDTERAAGGSAAAPGGATATANSVDDPTSLRALLGSRLLPAMESLESLPTELTNNLIPFMKEMLDLQATLQQKAESVDKFDRPWVDPQTNQPYKRLHDKSDQALPFLSSKLRHKCPMKAPTRYKDDDRMIAAVKEAESQWEQALIDMSAKDKNIKQLEMELIKGTLRSKFFDTGEQLALGLIIIGQVGSSSGAGGSLDRPKLTQKAFYDTLNAVKSIEESQDTDAASVAAAAKAKEFAKSFGCNDMADLMKKYGDERSYKDTDIVQAMQEGDKTFLSPIVSKAITIVLSITVKIWNAASEKDNSRKLDAELRKCLKPASIARATEDVAMALEQEDMDQPSEKFLEAIRKEAAKETKKQISKINKSSRKKSLVGVETQTSTHTASGTKKRKSSNEQQSKQQLKQSSKKQKQQQNTPKSALKKNTRFSASKSKSGKATKAGKSRANRGGSRSGGNGGGAGRR
jgi:hypothetical protein